VVSRATAWTCAAGLIIFLSLFICPSPSSYFDDWFSGQPPKPVLLDKASL